MMNVLLIQLLDRSMAFYIIIDYCNF